MGERAPVSTEETLVRYDNPVLVTKQPEKVVTKFIAFFINFTSTNQSAGMATGVEVLRSCWMQVV